MRMASRTVRRGSGREPVRAGVLRRVRRRGGVNLIRVMIRRRAASSSGVQAANDLCLSASTSEAIQPRIASSSPSDSPGSVDGMASAPCASAEARSMRVSGSLASSSAARKNRRNTRS